MSLMYEMLNSMQVFVLKPILIEQTFFSKYIPMKQDMQIYSISTCPPRTGTFTIAHIKLYPV